MNVHAAPLCDLNFLPGKPISLQSVQENFSSDGGLLLVREWDQQLGLTQGFAEQLQDPRQDPEHPVLQMVRSRVYGILAGYTDQNDHQLLRSDPVFKLLSGQVPQQAPLASQPTLSRFENAIRPTDLFRLEDWFIRRFVESFSTPPSEVTLDLDVFDDPTHGQQQLTLFHGFYDQYQYLVRATHLCRKRSGDSSGLVAWDGRCGSGCRGGSATDRSGFTSKVSSGLDPCAC